MQSNIRVAFVGQNGPVTLELLSSVQAKFNVVGLVESAPRGFDLTKYGGPMTAARRKRNRLWRISRRQKTPFFLLTRDNHEELADFVRLHAIDVLCVAGMSELLREPALSSPRLGAINFHPSLLPNYRGPNPWFWQYYDCVEIGGVSIFFLDKGEDTGDIIYQEPVPIGLGLPFEAFRDECLRVGGRLMCQALNALAKDACPRRPQRQWKCARRARGVVKDEKLIEWDVWAIERVWHVLRGTLHCLDAIPLPKEAVPGDQWIVGECLREPCVQLAGSLHRDSGGYFVAHRDGTIRLALKSAQ